MSCECLKVREAEPIAAADGLRPAAELAVGSVNEDRYGILPYIALKAREKVQNMNCTEKIMDHVQRMPEPEQVEVLDFIEYLESKARERRAREEEEAWSALSLANAMRGMEEEPCEYDTNDLKEKF